MNPINFFFAFLVLMTHFPAQAQKIITDKVIEFGAGPLWLISKGRLNAPSYSFQTGIGFRNQLGKGFYSNAGFSYGYLQMNNFESTLYDPQFKVEITLNSTLSQQFICFPIGIGYRYHKIHFELQLIPKYLFYSKVTTEAMNTNNPNVSGKYETQNQSNVGEYPSYNMGIGPKIEYQPKSFFSVFYRLSYDVEVNPTYSYLNTYNTLNNHLGFNLHF